MSKEKTKPRVVRYTGRRLEDITAGFWENPPKRAIEKAEARAKKAAESSSKKPKPEAKPKSKPNLPKA